MNIKHFVEKLSRAPMTFWQFMLALIAIPVLRVFLETFADLDNRWQILNPDAFIHYCLWFILTFLTISAALALITKEKILPILKVQIIFFSLIFFAPLLDLIVSTGQGADIAYIMGREASELLRMFLTFFGSLDNFEVSLGMRTEIIIAGLLIGCYAYLIRSKVWAAAAGFLSMYVIAFVYLALPNIVELLKGPEYSDKFYSFLILLLTVGCLVYLLAKYNRNKLVALARNARPYRILHYQLMLWGGLLLGKLFFAYDVAGWKVLAASIALLFAWLAQVGFNDLYDIKIDALSNNKRPLVSKKITAPEYQIFSAVMALLAILFAYTVSYHYLIFIAVFSLIYTIYSLPPLRLKRLPVVANFMLAVAALVIFMAGFSLPDHSYLSLLPGYIIALILVAFGLAINMKDIKDIAGDRAANVMTLPTLLGDKLGKQVVGGMIALSYLATALIIPRFFWGLLLVGLVGGGFSYWIINRRIYREKYIFLVYFGFLLVLAYYLAQIYL